MKKLCKDAFLDGLREGFAVFLNPILALFGHQYVSPKPAFLAMSDDEKLHQDWINISLDMKRVINRYE
ncbi:hypothetical protein G6R29_05190 [Fructobacillus sp. M2-14]|uniref:Uncharacterized protein n=1 Tax=Fructobacillus broussonetiae TaxID=2713173 RepID=A0ABS5R377_9LACO|nr:hypothetical protein [Fructobacillus broussonetiae]MBS9339014.1 hypothetical protein [Fructobacillus broussonetiae]